MTSTWQPASSSAPSGARRWSATPPTTSMSPRVAAAAKAHVPAAIRSETTACSVGRQRVDARGRRCATCRRRSMRAPIETSISAMSTISGSLATLSIVVVPRASTAAVRTFSVAPTLGKSSRMSAPCSPRGRRRDEVAVGHVHLGARAPRGRRRAGRGRGSRSRRRRGRRRRPRRIRATSGPSTEIEARRARTRS